MAPRDTRSPDGSASGVLESVSSGMEVAAPTSLPSFASWRAAAFHSHLPSSSPLHEFRYPVGIVLVWPLRLFATQPLIEIHMRRQGRECKRSGRLCCQLSQCSGDGERQHSPSEPNYLWADPRFTTLIRQAMEGVPHFYV